MKCVSGKYLLFVANSQISVNVVLGLNAFQLTFPINKADAMPEIFY
jgi:hypothetical protein